MDGEAGPVRSTHDDRDEFFALYMILFRQRGHWAWGVFGPKKASSVKILGAWEQPLVAGLWHGQHQRVGVSVRV